MNLAETEIEFKSSGEYFPFEETGIKNNTIRKIDLTDYRFLLLISMMATKRYGTIKINNAEKPLKDEFFTRNIRHICIYDNYMLITWNPEEIK